MQTEKTWATMSTYGQIKLIYLNARFNDQDKSKQYNMKTENKRLSSTILLRH